MKVIYAGQWQCNCIELYPSYKADFGTAEDLIDYCYINDAFAIFNEDIGPEDHYCIKFPGRSWPELYTQIALEKTFST